MRAHNLANTRVEANNVLTPTRGRKTRSGLILALLGASLWATILSGGCAGTDEGGGGGTPVLSRFESEPPGASVFVDGGFVGTTPTSFHLPAKPSVHVRLELPGYFPVDTMLDREKTLPAGAPAGTGWEDLYYWPLVRK